MGTNANITSGNCELGLTAGEQAGRQVYALLITLCFAVVGGLMAGFIAKQEFFQPPRVLFDDSMFWECEEGDEEEEDSKPNAALTSPTKLGELPPVKVPIKEEEDSKLKEF